MNETDKRLIEDYLPIEAISAEASGEPRTKGHISTLHIWRARRPLVACRAAVYGALVPASRFVPNGGSDEQKKSLGRANSAKFVKSLCVYPGEPRTIQEAQRHILIAHAERLTQELADWKAGNTPKPGWVDEFKFSGLKVTMEDITAGRAPRPRVLDMFAGGGSIPLEALRLGCDAYALDLNPVAHIIQLCTLVYPQKYGKTDATARGLTGPKNEKGETTWGGLAGEVRYWGNWVLKKVKAEIGDLYPPLPDPTFWNVGRAASPATQSASRASSPAHLFPSVKDGVVKTRRHLPHWEKEGACYFITYRAVEGVSLTPEAKDIILENWKHWSGTRYDLWQAVVMSNHVHVLISPLPINDVGRAASPASQPGSAARHSESRASSPAYWTLSEILHGAKSYTANEINKALHRRRPGCQPGTPLWQEERFDHIVRNPSSFEEKWHYIRNNPCKAGLAEKPEEYPWLYEDAGLAARPTLTPIAYLWTRTVTCKNPRCRATVPLLRQTWLCKKEGRYIALKIVRPACQAGAQAERRVRFEVVEATSARALGFDPEAGSKGGNATCPFCGTVADSEYVKQEGCAKRMGYQLMSTVAVRPGTTGKVFITSSDDAVPSKDALESSIERVCRDAGITVPNEPIITDGKNCCWGHLYGLSTFGDLFMPRQMLCMLSFAAAVQSGYKELLHSGYEANRARAVVTYLGVLVDRLADYNSTGCTWEPGGQFIGDTFTRQAIPVVWDFAELAPFGDASGSPSGAIDWIVNVIESVANSGLPADVSRGSGTKLSWADASFDAVITDPPYYDNVSYADLSDFFYVWLRRTLNHVCPEHFASPGTPKKAETVADATRHNGSKDQAREAYEQMMAAAFQEAHRVLKPSGQMTVVYAHKTTLGWSTLVDALRRSGFVVTEAWPLDTERSSRFRAQESAALASSIFLVARKRGANSTAANYETDVVPELGNIVRERVETLWEMGISGADLVIACVGAGLRAFTRYTKVEYANGEEVPAGRFLTEVETVVLETVLARLSTEAGAIGGRYDLASVDSWTRFYTLWRYTYKSAELDAGEAIIFANGTHVELDGLHGLSYGTRPLAEKKKAKYRLLDYSERGDDAKLGLPLENGSTPPLIDALHRILWLMERHPSGIPKFLREAQPNLDQMRLVAQALAGPALKGGELDEVATGSELAALTKLTANWRSVVEDAVAEGPLFAPRARE